MADSLSVRPVTDTLDFSTFPACDLAGLPLHHERFWLATALNSAADAIIIVAATGRVQFVNRAAEQLTGWTLRQAKGLLYQDVLKLEHAGAPLVDDLIRLAALNEAPLNLHDDLALISKSGEWIQIEAEIAPSALTNSDPQSSVFTFRDVTQRKWEEHQVREEHAIRAVERLAETTSHALNNLLTSILGHSELLLDSPGLIRPQQEAIGIIRSGALQIARVVQQLSAICRTKFVTRREVDLNDLIRRFFSSISDTLLGDILVKLELDPTLYNVSADESQIEQVLFALLSNARDASAAGHEILVSTTNCTKEQSESLKPAVTFAVVKVSDTGSGMTAETRERIFEPFFTTRKEIGRSGLGLCISQGIIRDYNGYLEVKSTLGEGTEISFGIPAVTPDSFAYLDHDSRTESAVKTILIVEDDDAVRKLLCKILAAAGYNAIEARGGEDALLIAQLHEGRIDILLTDVGMPGMSGTELVRQFAVLHPEARFLLLSGYSPDRIGSSANLPRGIDFLPKPFQQKDLLAKLEVLLS